MFDMSQEFFYGRAYFEKVGNDESALKFIRRMSAATRFYLGRQPSPIGKGEFFISVNLMILMLFCCSYYSMPALYHITHMSLCLGKAPICPTTFIFDSLEWKARIPSPLPTRILLSRLCFPESQFLIRQSGLKKCWESAIMVS